MKNKIGITFILSIILIGSICFISQNIKPDKTKLILAEKTLENSPDSALKLLQQIEKPEKLLGEEQALYALLRTRAENYNEKYLDSDSLIRIALNYYKDGEDLVKKAWSYYYYGTYNHKNKDNKKALECYQQASLAALDTKEHKLNELIYNHWGILLLKEKPYDDGINKQEKALEYAKLRCDSLSEGYILRDLGLGYMWKGDLDKAMKVHKEGLRLASELANTKLLSSLYNNLGLLCWRNKDHVSALKYVNKSLELNQDSVANRPSQSMKGMLFLEMKQYDSARYYIEKCGPGNDLSSKAYYYYALSTLESELGNYKKALGYLGNYTTFLDSLRSSEKDSELIFLQRRYDYSIIENENNSLKLAKQKDEILMLIISFIAVVSAFIYWVYYYRKKKEKESLIQMKDDLLKQSVIELQKKTVQLQKQQEELYSQKEELNLYQQKEQDLKSRILKMDTIIQKIESLNSYNEIKQNRSKAELVLSKKELADLEETVNLCYNNLAIRLREDFPKLKEDDIYLCCLIKIRVPNKNIISLLNTNDIALKKRRYRIKHERMELPNEIESLDQFLSLY